MVLSSSARPVRSAARGLAELSDVVHDGAGALAAAVLSRAQLVGRVAGPALSPSQHHVLRAAAAAMAQTVTTAAEQVTLTLDATTDALEELLGPAQHSSRGTRPGPGARGVRPGFGRASEVRDEPERAGTASPHPRLHAHGAAHLTPAQLRALHFYTTVEGVEEINRHLRRPRDTPAERRDDLQRLVDDAVAGLAALPRFDGVSYRGTTLPAADLPRWRPGAVVADRGFASSSASAPVAEAFRRGGNAFITIAGRTGADIRSLSFFAHEAEVLFAPGTRFRVIGRSWDHRRECWSFQIEEVTGCASTAPPTTR
ncbi:hypothetical protein E1212_23205 [Jiangella ureilytica]|uniref:NAD(+)--protein-arginine ADP-ribosyltransferase n=1 Tax=Jiangella ureilytica TaxID=2530374 RepID=A0A4R4REX3_9ACTN|nr:ADP-ribosyltransferase domain-containing protein [Jiangella ureilytica]TDC47764.1 hypothetical protein E1212_23205 [Jiangella ureilytica]